MRRCPPSRGSEGRGAACRLVAAGAGHRVPSARAEEGSLSEARGASVTPAPHARVLDEREPSPAGAGTPSSRRRSRATPLWVSRHVPARRAETTPLLLPPADASAAGPAPL